MRPDEFIDKRGKYLILAGLLLCLVVIPASATETLKIDPVPEPVIAGETIEFKGTSSLPAGSKLNWSFGTEGFIVEDNFQYYIKDKFRYYDESDTTTTLTGREYSKWKVSIDTSTLKPGYYDFQIAGKDGFAERMIIIDNEQKTVKNMDLSEISPDIDFYASPNSKFILDGSSGYMNNLLESCGDGVPQDFPSAHISSAETLIRGNELEIEMFTTQERRVGLWLYSEFPDNSYSYFKTTDSEELTGKAKISFGTDVTANLKQGNYYVFAGVAGRNFLENKNLRPGGDSFVSLPINPYPVNLEEWTDPEGKSIVSPASSVALDTALKAAENEIKYVKFRIAVEDPWIVIDTMDDTTLGKDFRISGTTNFEEGTVLNVEILPLNDRPSTEAVAWTGEAEVSINTNGQEKWGTSVNTYILGAGEYIIRVSDRDHKLTEDNEVIEIIDSTYGIEKTDDLVRSYSVDPVSKQVVRLNEEVQESPLSLAVIFGGLAGAAGSFRFYRRD